MNNNSEMVDFHTFKVVKELSMASAEGGSINGKVLASGKPMEIICKNMESSGTR